MFALFRGLLVSNYLLDILNYVLFNYLSDVFCRFLFRRLQNSSKEIFLKIFNSKSETIHEYNILNIVKINSLWVSP